MFSTNPIKAVGQFIVAFMTTCMVLPNSVSGDAYLVAEDI